MFLVIIILILILIWEVVRLPACKSGVAKQNRKRRTGALPALPTMNLTEAALRELCSLLSTAPPDVCARAGRAFHCRVVVKVARVPVKHLVLVRAQARQPLTRVAQLPERGGSNTEDEGESPSASATLRNMFGVAA